MNNIPLPPHELVLKFEELNAWRNHRTQQYGHIGEQLNLLWDDINDGVFGEMAKTGKWYLHIKNIKDQVVKPDITAIKAEIDNFIANNTQ